MCQYVGNALKMPVMEPSAVLFYIRMSNYKTLSIPFVGSILFSNGFKKSLSIFLHNNVIRVTAYDFPDPTNMTPAHSWPKENNGKYKIKLKIDFSLVYFCILW